MSEISFDDALERLVTGRASEEDIRVLLAALRAGRIAAASGPASVAITGDALQSPITTNHFHFELDGSTRSLSAEEMITVAAAVRESLPRPCFNLPPRQPHFTGRAAEIAIVCEASTSGSAAAITALKGVGGIGKTELAVEVAHRLLPAFPDGAILVELFGTGEALAPRRVMEDVVFRFQPQAKLPDDEKAILEIYRELLGAKRVLLVLDNAKDAAQIRDLLPPAPSVAIVTSRRSIASERVTPLSLDDLPAPEAKALVATIVGVARLLSEADLAAIAEACRCHPLALRVAATFLRDHRATPVATYVARITERRDKLKLDGDPDSDVVAVVGLSIENLEKADPDLARRWRDLAVFPADFGFAAAAMFWGDADADAGLERLERLETLGLVEPAGDGRHRLHDLLRDVALLRSPGPETDAARLRHAQVYCAILGWTKELYLAGGAARIGEALALFDRERANIHTGRAVAASRATVDGEAAALVAAYADAGVYVTNLRLHPREWIAWWQDALGGYRKIGNRRGEGNALGNLGLAYADLGGTKTAIKYYQQVLAIAREIGDRHGEGNSLGNLGNACVILGETEKAIEYYQQHLAITREIGDRRGEAATLGNLGVAYAGLGETKTAIEYRQQALVISREIGDRLAEGTTLGNLGLAYADLGEATKAIEHYDLQLTITREIGDRRGEGNALGNLGNAYAALGEATKAIEHHEQHLTIAREIGDRRGEGAALGNLGTTYAILGETEKAIQHYETQLAITREIGDRHGEANALFGNAVASAPSDPALARHLAGEALPIYEAIGSHRAKNVRAFLEGLTE